MSAKQEAAQAAAPAECESTPVHAARGDNDMVVMALQRAQLQSQSHGLSLPTDPSFWLGVGTALVELIMECRKNRTPAQLHAIAKNPNVVQRVRMRKKLGLRLGSGLLKKHGDNTVAGLVSAANSATDEEFTKLCQQVDEQ